MINDIISIIIPIYNVEKYLGRCLNSLLIQSYSNFEVIMVDDCSTDESKKIAEEYELKDSRFSLVCHQENKGLAASRNTGVNVSHGQWLFFVDSDDWLREDALEVLINDALENNSDVVMCGYSYVWDNGKRKEINSFGTLTNLSSHKEKIALIPQPSATRRLYRASFFHSLKFDFPETIKRGEDFPLTIPLLTYTEKISIVNKSLYYYYQRPGSISNTNNLKDFSFYDEIINITNERINKGFDEEIEFRFILELMYSKNFLLISSGYNNETLESNVINFTNIYPEWINNKYLKSIHKLKLLFIYASYKKHFNFIRILVKIRNIGRTLR